jgi:hypothetical protein
MRNIISAITVTIAAFAFATPAFAACQDQVSQVEKQLQTAKVSSAAKSRITTKLREAKLQASQKNEARCMSAVQDAREQLADATGGMKKK